MKKNYHHYWRNHLGDYRVCIDELSDGNSIYDDIAFVIDFIVVGALCTLLFCDVVVVD